MRKITFLLSFLFVVLGLSAQTNLVSNPSFESGFTGWTKGPTVSYVEPTLVTTGGAQDGANFVQYEPTATTGFYQEIPVTTGKSYALSFWYKASGDDTDARIWSAFKDGGGTVSYLEPVNLDDPLRTNNGYLPTATSWTKHSVDFVAPVGVTVFQFAVRAYTGGTVAFDNFSLVEVGASSDPELNVNPASLSFRAALSTPSSPQVVAVTASNLSAIPTYTVTGADAGMFAATGTLTAAGGNISVVFTPTSEGAKTASLVVSGGGITQTVNLTGDKLVTAGNLLLNPGFETWVEGKPEPWYVVSSNVTGVTPAPNTVLFAEGTQSIKIDATGASGTFNMAQSATIIPGRKYTVIAKYYIESD